MKKVTIITGGQGTGKSTIAKQMCDGKKYYESFKDLYQTIRDMPTGTEIIIIDMYFKSDILAAIKAEYLQIKPRKSKDVITLKVPDLIICTDQSVEFIEQIQATEIVKLTQPFF